MASAVVRRLATAVAAGLVAVGTAGGAQYFTGAGGSSVWNDATPVWATGSGGPYDQLWTGGDAVFEGTAGTVTVSTVTANSLTFNVAGYVLTNGTVTLAGPTVAANANANISAAISGSAGLVKVGAGALTLAGANTYSGGTTVSNGTLTVSADGQLGASGASLTLAGGTLRNVGALNTLTRPLTLGAGGGTISLGTYLNYYGVITGGTGLSVSGSDFILQPGAPNSLGTITLTGSRLFVNNADAIANNAAIAVAGGARLVFQGGGAPTAPTNPITFATGCGVCMRSSAPQNLTLTTTNAVFPSSGTFVFNNDDQATRGVSIYGTWPALTGALTFQVGGGNATVGAVTLGTTLSGSYGITKTNPGTLVLAASNSFTAPLSVEGGTVRLGNDAGSGLPNATNLTVKSGGTFDLAGFSPRVRGLTDTLGFGSIGTGLITNSGAEATLTITRASMAYAGTIAGPINVVIPTGGAGYQILSGNSTYTGTTTVFGSLETWGTNALGSTAAGTIITNNAGLSMKGKADPMVFAPEPLAFYGNSSFSLNTDDVLKNPVWTGPVTLAQGATMNMVGGNVGGSITITGPISGAGAINKQTALMTLLLSGNNSYSGGTTHTAGWLKLGSATALGTGAVALNGGLLDLNGTSATLGALSGTAAAAIVDTSAGAGTNTLTVNQAVNTTCVAPISNGLAKTVAFVKSGNGILTLSATNTFQGQVTVNGGTLRLGVAAALTGNPSTVTVNSGGTLDLYTQNLNNGARTVVIAGPGASGQSGALANSLNGPEAQVFNLTLSDNATVGTTGSKLNVYGTLNGGGKTLTVAGTGEVNIRANNGLQNLAGVTVNSGLLRLESSQSWAGTYTVNAGGTLDSYGTRTEAGSVVLNGGRLANGGGGPAVWTGTVALSGNSAVDTAGGHVTISNAVTGSGTLTKTGANTLTLAGAWGYGGSLTVSNGTLTVLGSLANASITVASNATFNGSGTLHVRVAAGGADTLVAYGALNLSGLTLDVDATLPLTGAGPFTLVNASAGTLTGRFASVADVPAGYAVAYYGSTVKLVSSGTLLRVQ